MKIFISHSHTEQILADAWKTLLEDLGTSIEAWYSSDPGAGGGIGVGKWRVKIEKELRDAEVVLAIFTPESKDKPWIYFECAYVLGMNKNKHVIPIIYYMQKNELPSPLQDMEIFMGQDLQSLIKLYRILVDRYKGNPVKDKLLELALEDYLHKVELHSQERLGESLFHGHFHDYHTAKKLEGEWFAKWTQDGTEDPFEIHPIKIWTTKKRLRIVGKGKDWADYYPMEGVVSSKGNIALSYWSQGEIPICGTTLLELIGGNRIMEGTWQGYTAKTLKARLDLIKGKAIIARDKLDIA